MKLIATMKLGLWTHIRIALLRNKTKWAIGYGLTHEEAKACIAGLKRRLPPGVAAAMLIDDLEDKAQGLYYRFVIAGWLAEFWCKDAEDACIRLLRDSSDDIGVRQRALDAIKETCSKERADLWMDIVQLIGVDDALRMRVLSALLEIGLAANSPFFDVILSDFQKLADVPTKLECAAILCKTRRREAILPVGTYWVEAPDEVSLQMKIREAVRPMDPDWASTEEAKQLVPIVLRRYGAAKSDWDRQWTICTYMEVFGAVDFVPTLRGAMESKSEGLASQALGTLRRIARRHDLKDELRNVDFAEKRLEAAARKRELEAESRRPAQSPWSIRPGQYFEAQGSMTPVIYGECLECTSPNVIYARCYSRMCPSGENGTFKVDRIIRIIDRSTFESAIGNL